MEKQEIEDLIDAKIRQHEWRVAIISGFTGGLLLAGMFHAIWLNRIS